MISSGYQPTDESFRSVSSLSLRLTAVVQLKRKPWLKTGIGFITRHADCHIMSLLYPTF